MAAGRRLKSRFFRHPIVRLAGFLVGIVVALAHFLVWCYEALQPAPAYAGDVDPTNAREFYSSRQYQAWSTEVFARQRTEYGYNFCVLCNRRDLPLHSDHIKPRSTHPHLALDPENGQILCEDHNMGKSNRYDDDWR